jgi:hypothetical protein
VSWQHAKDIAETVESILKSIGLLVAAAWAYWKFFLQAERETSITSRLQVAVLQCSETGHRLLELRSTLTNNGKVPCQIDLSQSILRVSELILNVQNGEISWAAKECSELHPSGQGLNVPVGASTDRVEFVAVRHPGIYHVKAFFAQTERDRAIYLKRLYGYVPEDLSKHATGWTNAAVISTHAPDMASIQSPSASISVRDRADTRDSV